MYIGLIGYMIGITFGTNDPQNIVVKVTSFIPLISSYIMPVRLATETASTMEAIVSLVILAVFGIILTIFSARLYKSNVLVYSEGGMIQSLKQSISILKMNKSINNFCLTLKGTGKSVKVTDLPGLLGTVRRSTRRTVNFQECSSDLIGCIGK